MVTSLWSRFFLAHPLPSRDWCGFAKRRLRSSLPAYVTSIFHKVAPLCMACYASRHRHFGIARSVCLSVPWRSCLGYRHAKCLQLSHRRPPEMCGMWTRPRSDVDPAIELPLSNLIPSTRRTHHVGWSSLPGDSARAWNALPSSVRSAPSLLQFRRDLKTALHVLVIVLFTIVSSCETDCNF